MAELLLKSQPLLLWVLLLPLVETTGIAYYLRGALSRPWLFGICSAIAVYSVLGFVVYRGLVEIGFSGNPTAQSIDAGFSPALAGVAYLVLTLAAVWGLSYIFRRAQ